MFLSVTNFDEGSRKFVEKVKHTNKIAGHKVDPASLTINEPLYRGSSHGIYACEISGWNCAIKEMTLSSDAEETSSILHEVEILEALEYHPNISRFLFHQIQGDKIQLFFTRYADTLRNLLEQRTKAEKPYFILSEIKNFVLDIVKGLEFLHSNSVIHRDLKTDNIFIMLDTRGEVNRLSIGNLSGSKKLSVKANAVTQIGTPAYMAPEVLKASQEGPYGFDADVWSLGMIIYELIEMKRPYEKVSPIQVPLFVSRGERPKFSPSTLERIPESSQIIELFTACTQTDPLKRPTLGSLKAVLSNSANSLSAAQADRDESLKTWTVNLRITRSRSVSKLLTLGAEESVADLKGDKDLNPMVEVSNQWWLEKEDPTAPVLENAVLRLVDDEKNIPYYSKYLANNENLFVSENTSEPVIISIDRKAFQADNDGKLYRVLMRSKETDLRTTITVPSSRDVPKALTEILPPHSARARLIPVRTGTQTTNRLSEYETKMTSLHYSFGLIYSTSNRSVSHKTGTHFEEFLSFIGAKVKVKDIENGTIRGNRDEAGKFAIVTKLNDLDIHFHVSTLLPDRQESQIRFIGTSLVVVVFKEPDAPPISPAKLKHSFNTVFVIVEPVINGTQTRYRMTVTGKSGIDMFPPAIPQPAEFSPTPAFKNFFLTKLVNGDRMVRRYSPFVELLLVPRSNILSLLSNDLIKQSTWSAMTQQLLSDNLAPLSSISWKLSSDPKKSMSKSSKKEKQAAEPVKVLKLFGGELKEIMQKPEWQDPNDHSFPRIVNFLMDCLLKENRFKVEGIFRLSANQEELTQFKEKLHQGIYEDNVSDVHVYSACLKAWLRDLESPLVPTSKYFDALKVDSQNRDKFLAELPELNAKILKKLVEFFRIITKEEHVAVTRMSISNVSIVLGPGLLRCPASDPIQRLNYVNSEVLFFTNLLN